MFSDSPGRILLFCICICGAFFAASCVKNQSMPSSLNGIFSEKQQDTVAITLNFLPSHKVVKHESGTIYYDTFSYYFTTGKINLKPDWTTTYPSSAFDFRQLDDTSFLVQNLNATIPENPETYMLFVKH